MFKCLSDIINTDKRNVKPVFAMCRNGLFYCGKQTKVINNAAGESGGRNSAAALLVTFTMSDQRS